MEDSSSQDPDMIEKADGKARDPAPADSPKSNKAASHTSDMPQEMSVSSSSWWGASATSFMNTFNAVLLGDDDDDEGEEKEAAEGDHGAKDKGGAIADAGAPSGVASATSAAGGGAEESSWSWISSVGQATSTAVQVAKSKSSEVYGLLSKDIEEVSTQASSIVGNTASTIKKTLEEFDEKSDVLADKTVDSVKKSVSSFWRSAAGYAQNMFTEEDADAEALLVRPGSGEPLVLDRLQAQLYALASDPATFLVEPEPEDEAVVGGAGDERDCKCELDRRQGEISELMVNNVNIRKHYSNLVPEQVSHKLFWSRYFYKVHLIELQEAKRQVLKRRAEKASRLESDEGELKWDDVSPPAEDIPDDVQNRLLSEYECELISNKMKKGKHDSDKSNATDCLKMAQLKLQNVNASSTQSSEQGSRNSPTSALEKDSTGSDDWEKLSSGEKSPKKRNSPEEEDWEHA